MYLMFEYKKYKIIQFIDELRVKSIAIDLQIDSQ